MAQGERLSHPLHDPADQHESPRRGSGRTCTRVKSNASLGSLAHFPVFSSGPKATTARAGWGSGVAGRVGPGRVWVGWSGGGEAGRVGRRVGWNRPVAVNVHSARKGVCNCGVKNALLSG